MRSSIDFYATNPNALKIFLEKLEIDGIKLPKKIVEPACGKGHLSKELMRHGYEVLSTDLYDHGFGKFGIDFLKSNDKAECFLTNPPFKFAFEFVECAIKKLLPNGYVIMFLRLQFLEGQKRYDLFKKYPPKYVYVNSKRQNCYKNADFEKYSNNSAICYSWFIWQQGFSGEPTVRWIY
jgi:hypothetical protein